MTCTQNAMAKCGGIATTLERWEHAPMGGAVFAPWVGALCPACRAMMLALGWIATPC